MVSFLKQPEIEAALLTAFLGASGWVFLEWRRSRQKSQNISARHQLPSPPANFVGRKVELAKLRNEFASNRENVTCIAVHGMAGVGKTALATVLAHKLKKYFPDAQVCLNLRGADLENRPPLKPAEAMQSIIQVFRSEPKLPDELDKLTPIYNGVLNEAGRILLCLDDVADAEQIRLLLPPSNCLLLVTSRSAFNLPGLVSAKLDCLQIEDSQKLLLKLAPRVKGYENECAELCGHLPLALEVFAGVLEGNKLYPVSELLERLRNQPGELTKLNAAFQVSYDLMKDDLALSACHKG